MLIQKTALDEPPELANAFGVGSEPAEGADWAVQLEPAVGKTVQRAGGFEMAQPAEKLTRRPFDLDWPGPQMDGPILPSRAWTRTDETSALADIARPPDPDEPTEYPWPPTPPLIGPMPLVRASSFDEAVLPVNSRVPALVQSDHAEHWGSAVWQQPEALFDRLDGLAWDCETGLWAREVARLVRKLGRAAMQGSEEASWILTRLGQLDAEAEQLAAELGEGPMAGKLRRAAHALSRRLDLWELAIVPGERLSESGTFGEPDPDRLLPCLARINAITADSAAGQAWREYLALAALERAARDPDVQRQHDRRKLARVVLPRLSQVRMSPEQRRFVASQPLAQLQSELRYWAADQVNLADLLRHVERYEKTTLSSDARLVAEDFGRLANSPVAAHQELSRRLGAHYRNANLRLAVAEQFLNRLMPEREPEFQPVRDTVLGRPVRGRSLTHAEVSVRLIPDPGRLRLALEIEGLVSALTASTSGPATFYNDSQSTYRAWKEIELGTWGIRVWPAQIVVDNDMWLRYLETDLDGIPLVGLLAHGVARSQHEQKRPEASREVEWKVAARAKRQIDQEAEARLGKLSRLLEDRVFAPLAAMSLEPTTISSHTTKQRMTIRMRLATDKQLGGCTPRPRAPSDSVLSFQIHESTFNNVIEQMELDGASFTLADLYDHIGAKLKVPQIAEAETDHDDVVIAFAEKDAVQVRFEDGQAILTLSIAMLSKPPRRWKDFQVRAFYRPETVGRSAQLVRDGVIHLLGEHLNTRSQIALRGIFCKTFHKQRPWMLVPERWATDPRLAQLEITQFVVEDGWVGIALGPARPLVARREMEDVD